MPGIEGACAAYGLAIEGGSGRGQGGRQEEAAGRGHTCRCLNTVLLGAWKEGRGVEPPRIICLPPDAVLDSSDLARPSRFCACGLGGGVRALG